MAYTPTDVIAMARQSINDPLGRRFSSADALKLFNRTLVRLFTERPDLFVNTNAGTATVTAPAALGLNSSLPYDDEWAQLHADMLVAEMETVPDDEMSQARSQAFDARYRR